MKSVSLFALASAVAALSGVTVSGHEQKAILKRHRVMAARAALAAPDIHARSQRARPNRLDRRKTPAKGDATKEPSNAAKGTYTAKQGCAVWHTVQDGEVCLGLIDKSSSSFTLAKFLEFNPSLHGNCDNLINGQAYCVDTVAGTSTSTKTASKASVAAATTRVAVVAKPTQATSTDDKDDDDEDDDDDCYGDDDDSGVSAAIGNGSSNKPQSGNTGKGTTATATAATTTTSSSAPAASSDASSSGSSDDSDLDQSGTATWYTQNGNAGNCGDVNSDSALIVALYTPQYENGANCGKTVKLVNTANGNAIEAKVADSCPSCEQNGNIDLSQAAFEQLSDNNLGLGVLSVKWGYV